MNRKYDLQMGIGVRNENKLGFIAVTSGEVDVDIDNLIGSVDSLKKMTDMATELLYALKMNSEKHSEKLKLLLEQGEDQTQADILMQLRDKLNSSKAALKYITRVDGENDDKLIIIKYVE